MSASGSLRCLYKKFFMASECRNRRSYGLFSFIPADTVIKNKNLPLEIFNCLRFDFCFERSDGSEYPHLGNLFALESDSYDLLWIFSGNYFCFYLYPAF